MNDLVVTVQLTPGKIESNFDEIKAMLKTQMTAYEELEVTEDNLKERAADVATLRKIRKAVDDRRKGVKRDFNEPYNQYEGQVKELLGIIDEQITRITTEMDSFEQARIAAKQAHIREVYDSAIGDYAEFLPYEIIKSSKWDNKTCSDKDIRFDISEMVTRVKSDLESIKALGSEIEEECIKAYKANGNTLAAAIQKNASYIEAKKLAEERARAEAERKEKEAAEAERKEKEAAEEKEAPEAVTEEPVEATEAIASRTLTLRIEGSDSDIDDLFGYLRISGLKWKEV